MHKIYQYLFTAIYTVHSADMFPILCLVSVAATIGTFETFYHHINCYWMKTCQIFNTEPAELTSLLTFPMLWNNKGKSHFIFIAYNITSQ